MSEEQKNQESKTRPKFEHVALTEESSQKINAWLMQVKQKKKGVRISRKDFVNWLIDTSPEHLSSGDLNALIERFYDEETFLRQLLREVKKARSSGVQERDFELVVKSRKSEKEAPSEERK